MTDPAATTASTAASSSAPSFLTDPPRFLFFTGKGGVGKTSIACASAVTLAEAGKRVLLVSTDPASNVGQVFDLTIGNTVTAVPAVAGLSALEIDPDQAAEAYRERIVGPVRDLLPAAEVAAITESLSGSCTTEIASFNEFTNLLAGGDGTVDGFDHVLFDTAPTGHTIRLLQLPGSWTEYLDAGTGDASCLGPLSGLDKQRGIYAAAVQALADPARTRLVLVSRAQTSGLAEIARTHTELAAIGLHRQHVVINGVLPDTATSTASDSDSGDNNADLLAAGIRGREQAAIAAMPDVLAALPTDQVALKATNMVGLDALRTLFTADDPTGATSPHAGTTPDHPHGGTTAVEDASLAALVDELATQDHGLVMCMGKGGVGKTTTAAAIAVALARRGHDVHLSTTDPAAHLTATLAGDPGTALDNLQVSRIDPDEATRAYRERVLATKGAALDDAGRAGLAEDLQSPCTEEVAVFQAFSRVINEATRRFVVVDTAPTGHTLLLLDATGSYHREIARQMGDGIRYTTPLMRLQDPDLTKIVIVTLAEQTPVLEATSLQADLERAGITPWAWVVNNSLAAAQPTSPLLRRRADAELQQINTVAGLARRIAVVPMLAHEPVGVDALAALTGAELADAPA